MIFVLWTICVTISTFGVCGAQYPGHLTLAEVLRRVEILENRDKLQQTEIDKLQRENVNLVNEVQQLRETCSCGVRSDVQQSHDTKHAGVLEGHYDSTVRLGTESMLYGKGTRNTSKTEKEEYVQRSLNLGLKSDTAHNRNRQTPQNPPIAFYATADSYAEHLGQSQPVVFNHVVTNIGQAFHEFTGIFTAPIPGIYVFSSTLLLFEELADFYISVNGQQYGRMYSYSTEKYETSSITSIFQLSVGDDVAIRSGSSDKLVHGLNYSSFSGFYLSPNPEGSGAQMIG